MTEENEIETEETEAKSVWNKKGEELTVGDAAKIQTVYTLVSLGVMVGIPAVIVGGAAAWEKFQQMREARKYRDKFIDKMDTKS